MLIAFQVLEFSLLDQFRFFCTFGLGRYLHHSFGRAMVATLFLGVGRPL